VKEEIARKFHLSHFSCL